MNAISPKTVLEIVPETLKSARKAWLLGMCGMGVGPLAIYMRGEGWDVSGWDDSADSPMRAFLVAAGVRFEKQFAPDVKIIGRSSAVKQGNPLYDEALKNGQRLLRRGELLAERVAEKKLIAVCGSHGKTTTSGMLAQALIAAGTDAGYVLGGLYKDSELAPARYAAGTDWVVAEVDESDGTIKNFSPEIAVVGNLDWDHPDYYKTEADLERTFRELFERTRHAIFIPEGSERLLRLTRGLNVPVFVVGAKADYIYRVVSAGTSETRLELAGKFPAGTISLPVAGTFNTQNAMLALAVTAHICDGRIAGTPLGKFSGMRRRQDVLFAGTRLKVFADYAHHPTEIGALLRLLRETHLGKLVVVFQPHRYSRTRQYAAEFANALAIGDDVLLMPVYGAGEPKIAGGEAADIFAAVSAGTRKICVCESPEIVLEKLNALADDVFVGTSEETVVAFVGAGDIDRVVALPFVRALWLREAGRPRNATEDFAERMKKLLSENATLEAEKNFGALTTLGVGGNARWYAEPADENDLAVLLRGALVYGLPIFTVGRGSNLLVPENGFNGLVIRLAGTFWNRLQRVGVGSGIGKENKNASPARDCLRVGAGTRLKELCAFAAKEGMSGFEFLDGIPGTLGGALRMNAGAHGASIFERVVSVEWLMPDGSRHEALREQMNPIYRDCPELHGAIVLGAILRATGTRAPEEIFNLMKVFAEARRLHQPRGRSAGCTFKNPTGDAAGRIIDALGLKGLSLGGAEVSDVHANFIVASETASARDVESLIRRVRGLVKAETGITLVPEIILVGETWGEI